MSGNARPGRNDPCPCGSGRKFKRCCSERTAVVDSLWYRLRQAEGRLLGGVLDYAVGRYGKELVDEAWQAFAVWRDDVGPPAEQEESESAFVPWLVFNWVPDPEDRDGRAGDWPQQPLAKEFIEAHGEDASALERRFVEEACRRPYSFYSVTAVEPGQSLRLEDVMTHRDVEILERLASTTLTRGAIVYARILSVNDVSIMCGCAPLIIPPSYQTWLIDLRESLSGSSEPLAEDDLELYDFELRNVYWDVADALRNPRPPQLCNTDGEPLVPTDLHFELRCTPRAAFDALKPLALDRTEDELLSDAVLRPDGELQSVRFDWLKRGNAQHESWETTVMGSIAIDGSRLVISVNSEARAERIRVQVARLLGDQTVFRRAVMENVEKTIEDRLARPETPAERRRGEESERLKALPEVREQVRQMMAAHWNSWLDKPIPALKNETPRQAARTPSGRERLHAVLRDFEWSSTELRDPLLVPDVAALRRELGL